MIVGVHRTGFPSSGILMAGRSLGHDRVWTLGDGIWSSAWWVAVHDPDLASVAQRITCTIPSPPRAVPHRPTLAQRLAHLPSEDPAAREG